MEGAGVRGLRVYKIVVLGDGGVGKSAVTLQFVSHSFLDYHDPTIEDSYQQQAVIDGEPALLDILDTAGQVEFTAMRDQYMRCGEGFVICYSVTDRQSFREAAEYRRLIGRVRPHEDIPLVLVANKRDLHNLRKVTVEEGRQLAVQLGCPFSRLQQLYVTISTMHSTPSSEKYGRKTIAGKRPPGVEDDGVA